MKAVFGFGIALYSLIGLQVSDSFAAGAEAADSGSAGGSEPTYTVAPLVEAISPTACANATDVTIQGICLAFPFSITRSVTPNAALPSEGLASDSK